VSQTTKRKTQSRSRTKADAVKSRTTSSAPTTAGIESATPSQPKAAGAEDVATATDSPEISAKSERVSPTIEKPDTSLSNVETSTTQAEQTPPSEDTPVEAPSVNVAKDVIAEQREQGTEDEAPSMEEVLAAAQPVQEPLDQEPQYIPPPLANKYLNKEALRDRLWLSKEYKPIISYVGRLDFQKGVNLIRHGIFYALEHGAQFVLLGTSPEQKINEEFWQLKHQLNDSPDCHLEIGFNEELSHLIYAGSDMIIMPSLYEPCGLAQMLSLKYGTVPIVRWVGGLADTVFDKDHSHKPLHERNGYVFTEPDAQGLESAMFRAIGCWYSYPDDFRQLIINGMRYDYSWNYPGQHYLNIYEHIRCK
jgi:glycosyltransferase involved in cell wall biosynthesis